ncbi:tetratricopeptide repeat protein [Pyruvatibacter sp.]|uniref:tetratricopeptide repeat protein n=1 Tax=Pyruvatibacter sp. TaxID=1981328 RepID=UPI0032EA9A25
MTFSAALSPARLLTLLLVAAGIALGASGASAQQSDATPDLDRLFEELAQADDAAQAAAIEDMIWRAWARSGSDTVDLIMARGLEALNAQDYAVALDMFSTAIELDPDYAESWNKRATLYYVINDYDAAIADVTQVLAREPRHWAALMGLAVMFDDLDRKEPALGAYRAALEINPQLEDAAEAIERLSVEVEGRGI